MRALIPNNLFRLTLMPAFLLAHFFCVCGGAVAAAPYKEVAAGSVTDNDACCNPAPERSPSNGGSDHSPPGSHQHDPNCDHCSGTTNLTAPEAASRTIPVDFTSFTLFVPQLIDHSALDASTRFQSYSRWLADPSPPPDLLRVKCSLQI